MENKHVRNIKNALKNINNSFDDLTKARRVHLYFGFELKWESESENFIATASQWLILLNI